ncbi:protein SFI1 homolog isoform X2 [Cuculus canorus]|uniref:protein SFI1 homolog isoform X2 n=1 Tax=Cuculus canorus TaxID=55661 RepID=UPI0023AA5BD7|nr:protein SFI1 homolog isoform X2 [Cuculus canorus]
MEESRSRYLARKYFCLWAKKTFGRVLPSTARSFYDKKHIIFQNTSGEWKEQWTVCRGKKLSLRAARHYRHLLLNLIFKAWRAYVCQQHRMRSKYDIAESHAKKQQLLRTWQCWLVYVDVRRTKHGMQSVAVAFRERSYLRMSWAVWRRRHQQNCAGRKMNILALQHWAQSLQFRAWLQWQELYFYSQNDKQKEMRAVTHHQQWELKRCMEAWLGYFYLRRAKKHKNELAQEHHRNRIVQQCFSNWRLSWECRRRMRTPQKGIEKLSGRIALWRGFACWKHYVVLRVEETQQCGLAEKHYNHYLLNLGFEGLWQNVMDAHLQKMGKHLSCRLHHAVLQKFWNRWKSRLEEKGEEQQQALTSVACARYRRVLMSRMFDMWLLKASKQQEYRLEEKRAVLHFERQLLRCFWCLWRQRTAACLEEQEGLVCARDHYSKLLLLKAFCLWKQNTQQRKTEKLKELQALRFHLSKCLQQTWNKWREYVGHQREKWRKLVLADRHYQHTLLGKTLAAWKSYQDNIQCILYHVAEKEEQRTRLLLWQHLHVWRENAFALIREAEATSRADEHYRRAVLSKVLLQWRCAASRQGYCRQQKSTAVMEARKHLDIARLQSLFLRWKKLTRESLMLRAQQHRAVQHHQQHLLQKYLVKWKEYHQRCLRKALLQRQGDQLMTRRLCSASFCCWKARLLEQQWEKQKTVQGLWHWSLSLQRKVFDAWLRFAKAQQQKKGHTEKVMGVSHTTFLREGASWDLRHTAGMKPLQGQLQAQCQLKQVTFEVPDVSPETRGHSAEEKPRPSQCGHLPFHLAGGHSVLSDLNAIRQARLPPRRPDFLLESLESKELLGPPLTRSETPFQQMPANRCSVHAGSLMPAPQMEESTCRCLSPMGNTTHSYPPLPSASLWTHGVHCAQQETLEKKLQPHLQPHLLLPEDFVGKGSCQTAAEREEREHSSKAEAVFQRRLGAELQHIQQQMQYYFSRKQELKSCQQQVQVLQKWLETSVQPKDKEEARGVQAELDQLQVRIKALAKAQPQDRHHVQNLLARLRDIQSALDT